MAKRIEVKKEGVPIYNINLERDFKKLPDVLLNISGHINKICVVMDSNVERLYANDFLRIIGKTASYVTTFVFPAGEEQKKLGTIEGLYRKLIRSKFDRSDALIALGGGVTGDMTGFAAATYLRGIPFVQIPTSLLAMVDSSIGGKTGVDLDQYKNMVGAFHQPSAVYMNLSVLETLSDEHYFSGFGEVVKHGIIMDEDYFHYLENNKERLLKRDMECLEETVYRSCLVKREIVEKDPNEKGERAILNFGHTLGHAIEKYMDFKVLHGQCVSLGMVAASYISKEFGNLKEAELRRIVQLLGDFHLPIQLADLDVSAIVELTKNDKKRMSGRNRFILVEKIGKAYIEKEKVDDSIMESGVKHLVNQHSI